MKKKTLPQQFDQMFEGMARFIVANGDRYTQVCCDCGSSHDVVLRVINDDDEMQVELIKNPVVTKIARQDGCNGVLMSRDAYMYMIVQLTRIANGKHITKSAAKALLDMQKDFTAVIKTGVAI